MTIPVGGRSRSDGGGKDGWESFGVGAGDVHGVVTRVGAIGTGGGGNWAGHRLRVIVVLNIPSGKDGLPRQTDPVVHDLKGLNQPPRPLGDGANLRDDPGEGGDGPKGIGDVISHSEGKGRGTTPGSVNNDSAGCGSRIDAPCL